MKEKYTLLLLSLVFVVMLYGITSVLAGWSSPSTSFPTSNVTPPIDTGQITQQRKDAISFNRNDGNSGVSVDIMTKELKIGNYSSSDFFIPYTNNGPIIRSNNPITISAAGQGLVIPNVADPNTETAAKMEGNLVFDSTLKQLKVYAGNVWNSIGSGENFWTQDGNGISYTGGPVSINSAKLVVNGDIKANETQPAKFFYFPEYSPTPMFVTDNPVAPQGYNKDILKYNFKIIPEAEFGNYVSLLCDSNKNILDCLSTKSLMSSFIATASDPDIKIDVVRFDQTKNPDILVSGNYAMVYKKYAYQYDYVATGGYNNTGVIKLDPTNNKPRYFCDTAFNPSATKPGDGQECVWFGSGMGQGFRLPAPPPESGWPNKIYDWMFGTWSGYDPIYQTNRVVNAPAAQEFTRMSSGSTAVSGGKISFSGEKVNISNEFRIGPNAGNDLVEKKEVIGNYSFCALGRFWSDLESRGWCDVYYDINDSVWKISYGAWQNTGIACKVNCF